MNKNKQKNNIVGLKELRNNFETYITRVNKGESFTVVRRSRPVFKLAPLDEDEGWETIADFTTIDKNGVSARDILKTLKRLNG